MPTRQIIIDQEEKKEAVWNLYNGLLGTAGQRDLTLDLEVFHWPNADLVDLEQFFSEDKIWNTIKTLSSDKAPGPDGFTGRFYKVAWQVIRVDFMAAVGRMMQGDVNKLHLLNSAYITLLPTTAEAVEVKDYRPISLIHSFARIITKAMANRLANKLSTLNSPCQSALVKGRYIHDNFILVQQTARALHRQNSPRVLLKLDISKAFNLVSWPFLFEVLSHLGFGPFWCNILSKLLRSSSTRVLMNGELGDLICHQRGLRQGNLLSPMLFIIVMDVLNSLILKASERRLLQPIFRRGNGQRVSLYADDVVMFLQSHRDELSLVKEILKIFGAASGLVTNIRKSSVTPIRCQDQDMEVVQTTLPCSMVEFPCKYLGLPLSVKKLSKNDFLALIDKIADYLPGWKATLMHPARRAILVRAVLTAVPIHHLIAVQCPKWVLKAMNKIIRAFLWKRRKDIKGGHCLVGW
jgi:hypothetical protein